MKARARCVFMICVLLTGLCSSALALATSETYRIYVSPVGGDDTAGGGESTPVRTLAKALQAYDKTCNSRSTRIVLAPGNYGSESLILRRIPCPLLISSTAGNAIFTGQGEGTWLTVATPGAGQIELTISGVEINNYQSAISINGNRNDAEGWIGGVRILNSHFVRIGTFRADQQPATAAIRLVNARSILIEGNTFQTIRNLTHCGGMHAIYIAHYSSNNRIVGNTFVDGCGETIKVRDSSNNNAIERNIFAQQEGSALFLDSYCDSASGGECTKTEPECPSWNNAFRDNTINGPRPASNKKFVGARRAARKLPINCALPRDHTDRILEQRTLEK